MDSINLIRKNNLNLKSVISQLDDVFENICKHYEWEDESLNILYEGLLQFFYTYGEDKSYFKFLKMELENKIKQSNLLVFIFDDDEYLKDYINKHSYLEMDILSVEMLSLFNCFNLFDYITNKRIYNISFNLNTDRYYHLAVKNNFRPLLLYTFNNLKIPSKDFFNDGSNYTNNELNKYINIIFYLSSEQEHANYKTYIDKSFILYYFVEEILYFFSITHLTNVLRNIAHSNLFLTIDDPYLPLDFSIIGTQVKCLFSLSDYVLDTPTCKAKHSEQRQFLRDIKYLNYNDDVVLYEKEDAVRRLFDLLEIKLTTYPSWDKMMENPELIKTWLGYPPS